MGEQWKLPKDMTGAEAKLTDLMRYTGLQLSIDGTGTVTFDESSKIGTSYASSSDLAWIKRVQNDSSQTDITGLWSHLVNGDDWHRQQFGKAYVATTVGTYNPATEAAKQGNSWGIYQAPAEYQDDPAFIVGIWSWRVAQVAGAIATFGASMKANAVATGTAVTTGTTAAASPAGQRIIQSVARLPVPSGIDLGRQLWGQTPRFAQDMLEQISRAKLENMGITREWAANWLRFYQNEALRAEVLKIVNPSVLPRVDLLKKALELLGG